MSFRSPERMAWAIVGCRRRTDPCPHQVVAQLVAPVYELSALAARTPAPAVSSEGELRHLALDMAVVAPVNRA